MHGSWHAAAVVYAHGVVVLFGYGDCQLMVLMVMVMVMVIVMVIVMEMVKV